MTNQRKPGYADGYRYLWKRMKLGWEKNGGKICTIAGTTGLFLTGVHACRTTYKHHDELAQNGYRMRLAKIKRGDEKTRTRVWRVAKESVICGAKTAKHYLPDIVGGALSSYAVGKGWHKEHAHYEQAAAVVGVLAADFMNYRKNVIAEMGSDADRRYLTTRRGAKQDIGSVDADAKNTENETISSSDEGDGLVIDLDQGMLRILYSKATTPLIWSESLVIRQHRLMGIENELNIDFVNSGFVTLNDIRRHFYGKKGDIPAGAIYGRIWAPGDPEHPERGRMIDLHFKEDVDFWTGAKDSCWITIDIDPVPLIEMEKQIRDRDGTFRLTEV